MNEYSIFEESLYRPAMARESSGNITFGFKNNIEMKIKSKNDKWLMVQVKDGSNQEYGQL